MDDTDENNTGTFDTNIEMSNEIKFEISPERYENVMKKRSAVQRAAGIITGTALKGAKLACCIGLGIMLADKKRDNNGKN